MTTIGSSRLNSYKSNLNLNKNGVFEEVGFRNKVFGTKVTIVVNERVKIVHQSTKRRMLVVSNSVKRRGATNDGLRWIFSVH